jgi:hypothetical protein
VLRAAARSEDEAPACDASDCLRRLHIDPAPDAWRPAIDAWLERRDNSRATQFRSELGLPTHAPLIGTGHQAGFWHPGVLAKLFAADAAATSLGARAFWIIPDQDDEPPEVLSVPTIGPDGALRREGVNLRGAHAGALVGVAAGSRKPIDPGRPKLDGRPALASVEAGLDAIIDALRAQIGDPTLARQATNTAFLLTNPLVSRATVIASSDLNRTTLFQNLLDRLRAEPDRALDAYERAARAHPQSGVLPLAGGREPGRRETPFWRLAPGEPRRRVTLEDLETVNAVELAPRGLMMTALVRLAGADLFIHGLGGGVYDRVTDQWIREWLGEGLAPDAVVTADLLLPLPGADVDEESIDRAVWRAHRARHDPALLGDDASARTKRALVERINALRAHGQDPSGTFREMHDLLERVRAAHGGELARLDEEAARMRRLGASREIARDRTWAFPLHEMSSLSALRRAVAERFGVEA